MIRVTICCPEELRNDANQLASALGRGPHDDQTFGPPSRERNGTWFSLASFEVGADWLEGAMLPLSAPGWEVDLFAAENAQAKLNIWQVGSPLPVPQPSDEQIVVIVGLRPLDAVVELGLMSG
jgi:hypothetical protein